MALPILLMGKSGTGKSSSMRNFKEDEITLINVEGKYLPFKNNFKYIVNTDKYDEIKAAIERTPSKIIVIDDAGYLITNQFMKNHTQKTGNGVFTLYNDLADGFWNLIEYCKKLEGNKTIYFIMHEDKNEFGDVKPKTIGKLLDEKVCIEGMFTIALRSAISNGKYVFKTNSDNLDVCKSPIGMFASQEIDNDLKVVDTTIREYYEMKE